MVRAGVPEAPASGVPGPGWVATGASQVEKWARECESAVERESARHRERYQSVCCEVMAGVGLLVVLLSGV